MGHRSGPLLSATSMAVIAVMRRVVEPALLVAMEDDEWTGRQLTLRTVDNVNIATE